MASTDAKADISLVEPSWLRRSSKVSLEAAPAWSSYRTYLTDADPTSKEDLADVVFDYLEQTESLKEPRRSACRLAGLSIKRIDCSGELTGSCKVPVEIKKDSPPKELLDTLQEVTEHQGDAHLQILTVCLTNDESDPMAIELPRRLLLSQIGCHFKLPLEKMRALTCGSWIFQGSQALLDDQVYILRGSSTVCRVIECTFDLSPFVIILIEEGLNKTSTLGLLYTDRILQSYLTSLISRTHTRIPHLTNTNLTQLVRTAIVSTFSNLLAQDLHHAIQQEDLSAPPEYTRTFTQTGKFITEWHRFQEMLFQHMISCSQAEQIFAHEAAPSGDPAVAMVEETIQHLHRSTLHQYQYALSRGQTHERKIRDSIQIDVATRSLEDARLGVEVSQMGIDQAKSLAWLTKLAFLFIPMTFVTGVFGMNIRAFGGGAPDWQFWVTMVSVSGGVFAVWFLNTWMRQRMQRRRQLFARSRARDEE